MKPTMGRAGQAASRLEERVEGVLQRPWVAAAAVAAATASVILLRLGPAMAEPGAGGDYGHYLIAANWILGQDMSGEGPFDPPLVALIVAALRPALGPIPALQVLGPMAAAAPVPGAYFLFSRFVARWAAVASATLLATWQSFTELTAFGGVTTMLGLAFALVFYRFLHDALDDPARGLRPRRVEVWGAVAFFLVLLSHHLTAFMVAVTAAAWVALLLATRKADRRATFETALRAAGLCALAAAPFVPYLVGLLTTEAASGLGTPVSSGGVVAGAGYAWRFTPFLWLAVLGAGLLSAARIPGRSALATGVAAMGLTPLLLLLTIFYTHPTRLHYYTPLAVVLLAALATAKGGRGRLRDFRPRRAAAPVRALSCVVLVLAAAGVAAATPATTAEVTPFYRSHFAPGTVGAAEWVGQNLDPSCAVALDTPPDDTFNPLWKGASVGWLMEGLANRRVLYEGHPPLMPFATKWPDVRDANRLFAGEYTFEDGRLRVADSFPTDDWAGPRVHASYYGDYREFVGLGALRLLERAGGADWWIISAANASATRTASAARGTVQGNYEGPDFTGARTLVFDAEAAAVDLQVHIALAPGAPWDGFQLMLVVPPWTEVDMSQLGGGRIGLAVPPERTVGTEAGTLTFETQNMTGATATAGTTITGERGYLIEWAVTGSDFTLEANLSMAEPPSGGPARHDVLYRDAPQILEEDGVCAVVVQGSPKTERRLSLQPLLYERVFESAGYRIYRVV